MSFDKKTIIRYKIINECLGGSGQRYWSVNELISAMLKYDIVVKRRTILYDIDALRYDKRLAYNAPIEYCKANKGYYYAESDFTIEKVPLSKAEFETLANVLSLLKFKHAFKDFESVIDKLLILGSELSNNLDTADTIEFEKAPYYVGEIHIDPLRSYIKAKQPLTVEYRKFNADRSSMYTLHPYYLKEYANLWYLLCYYEEADEMRTFALDRIINMEKKDIEFIPCSLSHPMDYFKDIIGITLAKGPVQDIILSFSPALAPYIKAKPIHHSQETLLDNIMEFQVKLKLIPNYELYSTLLSHVKKVKVISPKSIVEEMEKM